MTTAWTHNVLARDLAQHLRSTSDRLVWTDMQIGPSGSPRPDVYTIPKAYAKFRPMAYEVKISNGDFRRDVTSGKWQSYLEFAAGVIFCVPRGLVAKSDVPAGCGLMTRSDTGWANVKGPTLKHVSSLPHEAWMKLLIDGLARQREDLRIKQGPEWACQRAVEARYGAEIGCLFRDCNSLEYSLKEKKSALVTELKAVETQISELQRSRWDREKRNLEEERHRIEVLRDDLCKSLGIAPDEWRRVKELIADIHSERASDAEVNRATDALMQAHRAIKKAIESSSAASEERVRSYMEKIGEPLSEAAQ